jgi:hypothetical protein
MSGGTAKNGGMPNPMRKRETSKFVDSLSGNSIHHDNIRARFFPVAAI